MVTLDALDCLDALIWLRTGDRAAAILQCTQSSVSRNSRRCLNVFQLRMKKLAGEWVLQGDPTLLNLQRRVHQLVRWNCDRPLRLDAQHWCAHLVEPAPPPRWLAGNLNYFEYERPLQLLGDGVIDVWICSAPDLPDHPDLASLQLTAMPLHLVVRPGHPLLQRSQLSFDDLADYPVLPLPDGAFPIAQRLLQSLGLWSCPERDARLRQAPWYGQVPVEELMVGFDNPLRMAAGAVESWVPLPLNLPLQVGDALVVRRDFADHPRFRQLAVELQQRLAPWAQRLEGVEILDPQPGLNTNATPLLQ